MPITYERDDQRCRINVRLSGLVTVEDLLAIVDRQAAESTWQYSLCYDARQVTKEAAGTVDEVRRVLRHTVETSAKHGERGPVAIITDNPADYNIVRMYSALGAPQRINVEVFRDPADALRWLDFVASPKRAAPPT
jgi:RecJ-like exonuclease